MKLQHFVFVLLIGSMIGCISKPDATTPRRIDINLNVENIGETIIAGGDTLRVDEFKFIVRRFHIIAEDSVVVQTGDEISSFVFSYNTTIMGDRIVLSTPLGYDNIEVFESYHMFVNRARDTDQILDGDFFGEHENYSIIAKGFYNDRRFTFRSTYSFDEHFLFDDKVTLDDVHETLLIRVLSDIEDIFLDSNGGNILNPLDSANRSAIVSQFQNNLKVEAHGVRMIP